MKRFICLLLAIIAATTSRVVHADVRVESLISNLNISTIWDPPLPNFDYYTKKIEFSCKITGENDTDIPRRYELKFLDSQGIEYSGELATQMVTVEPGEAINLSAAMTPLTQPSDWFDLPSRVVVNCYPKLNNSAPDNTVINIPIGSIPSVVSYVTSPTAVTTDPTNPQTGILTIWWNNGPNYPENNFDLVMFPMHPQGTQGAKTFILPFWEFSAGIKRIPFTIDPTLCQRSEDGYTYDYAIVILEEEFGVVTQYLDLKEASIPVP